MKKLKFKTNINCGGCVSAVTTALNETAGENNWEVDTKDPQKILTVTTGALSASDIETIVKNAGFKAEAIS